MSAMTRDSYSTTVRLGLAGTTLPRIEAAVRIGELIRMAIMSAADRWGAGNGIPTEISGHLQEALDHRHAFYLPEDADGDGHIDHVLIYAPGGLSSSSIRAIENVAYRGLWSRDGDRWAVIFEGAWESPLTSNSIYGSVASTWVSVTPYLHPWYSKNGFGVPDQVARECSERAFPAPTSVLVLPSIDIGGCERWAAHFHRFRSKRGLRQPDTRGSLLEVTFAEAVPGPLALGFGCHFGLGIFRPLSRQ
jgi:CRISPR-associated protein Csb2